MRSCYSDKQTLKKSGYRLQPTEYRLTLHFQAYRRTYSDNETPSQEPVFVLGYWGHMAYFMEEDLCKKKKKAYCDISQMKT